MQIYLNSCKPVELLDWIKSLLDQDAAAPCSFSQLLFIFHPQKSDYTIYDSVPTTDYVHLVPSSQFLDHVVPILPGQNWSFSRGDRYNLWRIFPVCPSSAVCRCKVLGSIRTEEHLIHSFVLQSVANRTWSAFLEQILSEIGSDSGRIHAIIFFSSA